MSQSGDAAWSPARPSEQGAQSHARLGAGGRWTQGAIPPQEAVASCAASSVAGCRWHRRYMHRHGGVPRFIWRRLNCRNCWGVSLERNSALRTWVCV